MKTYRQKVQEFVDQHDPNRWSVIYPNEPHHPGVAIRDLTQSKLNDFYYSGELDPASLQIIVEWINGQNAQRSNAALITAHC